jgi:hypothetical protein
MTATYSDQVQLRHATLFTETQGTKTVTAMQTHLFFFIVPVPPIVFTEVF